MAAALSAALLELPFPLAGPLPAWRSVFAWFALVPVIVAVLWPGAPPLTTTEPQGRVRRGFWVGYLFGVLWYGGNCYWIYDTMHIYGALPSWVSVILLIAFSLYLGLYFGVFGLALALVRRATGDVRLALLAVPFLWIAVELASARVTGFPWDQLGDSQVDNALLIRLAPWTGAYGIGFVVAAANALLAGVWLLRGSAGQQLQTGQRRRTDQRRFAIAGLVLMVAGTVGLFMQVPRPPGTATAVLVQPDLNVAGEGEWDAPQWNQHMEQFARLAAMQCKTYIAGVPQTGAPMGEIICPPFATHPNLIAWPESPAPFFDLDPRFSTSMAVIAQRAHSPLIVGGVGVNFAASEQVYRDFNSAFVFAGDGQMIGRYDKIHLVPFGEYIPFQKLLSFAHSLTGRVSSMDAGEVRKIFRMDGHRYGIFICYEAVFADEVRQFAQLGGEVFVNVSDDGWYGDTSAPWQHLNMARMRAAENHRWILRDTNNGVTAAIDPYGTVRQSIPRHQADALPASYGFESSLTYYTIHGDLFAWACAILSIGLVGWSARKSVRIYLEADQNKDRLSKG